MALHKVTVIVQKKGSTVPLPFADVTATNSRTTQQKKTGPGGTCEFELEAGRWNFIAVPQSTPGVTRAERIVPSASGDTDIPLLKPRNIVIRAKGAGKDCLAMTRKLKKLLVEQQFVKAENFIKRVQNTTPTYKSEPELSTFVLLQTHMEQVLSGQTPDIALDSVIIPRFRWKMLADSSPELPA